MDLSLRDRNTVEQKKVEVLKCIVTKFTTFSQVNF